MTPSGTTVYHYDLAGNLISETDSGGTPIRDYLWHDATPIAQIDSGPTETLIFLHSDHLQTPRLATNSAGAAIWRWEGAAFGGSPPNEDVDGNGQSTTVNLRFPGQYFDGETGRHYNWNRYYDPRTGRYVTSDPTGVDADLNTYLYALANPNLIGDPDAREAIVFGGEPEFIPIDPPLPFDPCFGPTDENCSPYKSLGLGGQILFTLCRNWFGDRPSVNCVRKCLIVHLRAGDGGVHFWVNTHFKCWDVCRVGF